MGEVGSCQVIGQEVAYLKLCGEDVEGLLICFKRVL